VEHFKVSRYLKDILVRGGVGVGWGWGWGEETIKLNTKEIIFLNMDRNRDSSMYV